MAIHVRRTSLVTPPAVPGTVGSLTGTAGDTEVGLTWTAAAANGGTITDHDTRHSTDEAAWTTLSSRGAELSDTVTGLTNSTLYYFQVRAVNAAGAGAWSASETETPVVGSTTFDYTWADGTSHSGTDMSGSNASFGAGIYSGLPPSLSTIFGSYASTVIYCSPTSSTTVGDAVSNGAYVEFPLVGTSIDPTEVTFKIAKGGSSGTRSWALRSSADSYAANIDTATITNVRYTFDSVTVVATGVAPTTDLTFRLYVATPSSGASVEIDDFRVAAV